MTVLDPTHGGFRRVAPVSAGATATIQSERVYRRRVLGTNATVDVVFDVTGYYTPGSHHWAYTYDSTSLRSTKTGPDDTTTEFAWSATGGLPLLLGEHDTDGDTWITYGPGGRPVSQINPDNTVRWLHHDQIGWLLGGRPSGVVLMGFQCF